MFGRACESETEEGNEGEGESGRGCRGWRGATEDAQGEEEAARQEVDRARVHAGRACALPTGRGRKTIGEVEVG